MNLKVRLLVRNHWLTLILLLVPASAQAAWHEASGEHFVIYDNTGESKLRTFAEQLERYHAALAFISGVTTPKPSPSNRVTIYVMDSGTQVKELAGGNRRVAAFYIPRAGGSLAIVPPITTGGRELDFSMKALLHEYAHHFMFTYSNFPVPRWLSEGSAEFFAAASFEKDGSVGLGRIANHRFPELFRAPDVTAELLIDQQAYEKQRSSRNGMDAYYGKAWLLYHHLRFSEARTGQLTRYGQMLVAGKTSREAGLEAFGDFKALEKDLEKYMVQRLFSTVRLKPAAIQTGPVTLRRLGEGHGAIMPTVIRSRRGVNADQAAEIVIEARKVAERYPDDPAVQTALAEAEHDAGNHDASIAAADKAIAADPQLRNARVQKGLALFAKAVKSGQPQDFTRARNAFVALNRIENDHPLPLVYFYQTYTRQSLTPPPVAVDGLTRAAELAPFDLGLRMMLASQQLRDGKPESARRNLLPVAYNPHGGRATAMARAMLERLDADPKWDGRGIGMDYGARVADGPE